jgi:predicted tellurium resistance membrane protein TerC
LAAILFFVGTKMITGTWLHIPVFASLLVILAILSAATLASLVYPPVRTGSKVPLTKMSGE